MLAHYVNITPEPLHWIVLENRTGAREVHQIAEYFARPSSEVSVASEQPNLSQLVNLCSPAANVHQFVGVTVKHPFKRFARENGFCHDGLRVN
jgi:hypothetical protein